MDEQIAKNKKELKQKAQEMKIEEKQKKLEEKFAIKAEKEKRKNSFGRKVRNFFLTIIFVIILLGFGFYFGKQYLIKKEVELKNKKMEQTYQSALESIENKEYKKAIEMLQTITEDYSKYSEVKYTLKEVEQLYLNEYLSEVSDYLKDKKYEQALKVFEKMDKELQNSTLVKDKKIEIKIAKLNNEVLELENKKESNLKIIKHITEYNSENNNKIESAKDELISKYKSAFLLETRSLITTDYAKAKQNIEKIKEILPKDEDIKKLVDEFNKANPTPISLLSLDNQNKKGKLIISNQTEKITSESTGTSYDKYILKQASTKGSTTKTPYTIEFNLNKEYTELKGIICTHEKGTTKIENTYTPKITFYNGNKILYYTENVSDSNFTIDVKDVDKLTIEFEGTTTESYFIANPELTPSK